jgi:hypothetical protein
MTMPKRPTYRNVVAGVRDLTGKMKYKSRQPARWIRRCVRGWRACVCVCFTPPTSPHLAHRHLRDPCRPWLLEVNATPSLAVQHSDPHVLQLIRQQKEGMVADMVSLLRLERRYGRKARRGTRQPTHGSRGQGSEEGTTAADGDAAGGSGDSSDADGEAGQRLREELQATYPEVSW